MNTKNKDFCVVERRPLVQQTIHYIDLLDPISESKRPQNVMTDSQELEQTPEKRAWLVLHDRARFGSLLTAVCIICVAD